MENVVFLQFSFGMLYMPNRYIGNVIYELYDLL